MTIQDAKKAFRDYFANNADDEIVKSNIGEQGYNERGYHKLSGPGGAEIFINLLTDDKVEFYVYGSIDANAKGGLLSKIRSAKIDPTQWNFGENVSVKWGPNTNNGNGDSGNGHVLDVSTGLSWKNLEQDENNQIKNKACSIYSQFWKAINLLFPLAGRRARRPALNRKMKLSYNLIVFGAPGTGKSHYLDDLCGKKKKDVIGNSDSDESYFARCERVTFYPTYSYAQFVGSYKPVMKDVDKDGFEVSPEKKGAPTRKVIGYEFVPGPFLQILKEALLNEGKNYLLIVEEINRANAAAVFGDVFQLLDRNDDGKSEYSITPSQEMIEYLERKCSDGKDGIAKDVASLRIPSNLYIWATMNSADQGVFPLDTAFKRRWDFEYMSLDDNKSYDKCSVEVGKDCSCDWGDLRRAINSLLKRNQVNEDKLLSSSFVRPDGDDVISSSRFKMKVLMYLWEDAARMCRRNVFAEGQGAFSDLIKAWDNVKYSEGDDDILKKVFQFNDSKEEQILFSQREDVPGSENPEETKGEGDEGGEPGKHAEETGAAAEQQKEVKAQKTQDEHQGDEGTATETVEPKGPTEGDEPAKPVEAKVKLDPGNTHKNDE